MKDKEINTEFHPVKAKEPGKIKGRLSSPLGIGVQIALGFGLFTIVTVALLWIFQIFLLNPFYQAIKTTEVKSTADTVERWLEDEELDNYVQELSYNTGVNIMVTDELGFQYSGWKASQKDCLLDSISRSRANLAEIFNDVNLRGGSQLNTYTSPFISRDGTQADVIVYARICRTQSELTRMILIESEITPVDSTVETLKVQLIWLSVVMVLLGMGVAFFISRRIARPLTSINESAKRLGRGEYTIRFSEEGTRETTELAQTLNYAAGELSKVEQLRRELLANVSHDLRTPLTMIKGYSEVMRDLPGENTPDNVQIIIDETERLTNLVNDLLDLSRLEAGAALIEKAPFSITESIRNMLERYDKLADYSFPFYADSDVVVDADELKISQVVYNLVNNAINYAGEDKTVTLRQTVENGKVRISVSDTGEGIPADKLRDIWERYYKVDKEHKRAQIGTGLGLSIVKNVLELHGGTYGVSSELGVGSTFWFELPIYDKNLV